MFLTKNSLNVGREKVMSHKEIMTAIDRINVFTLALFEGRQAAFNSEHSEHAEGGPVR